MNRPNLPKKDVRGDKISPSLNVNIKRQKERNPMIQTIRTANDKVLGMLFTMPNQNFHIKQLIEQELRKRHNGKLRIEL